MGREGIEIIPGRVEGIRSLKTPKDKQALQRFLGMVCYVARFIPHLATKTEYLRQLIKKNTKWSWDKKAQEDFEDIKKQVMEAPVLNHFNQDKEVTISADASQYGLGAAMMQGGRPIAYASATLTETQRNYPPIEKEMLAIVFGCEKFHRYIYGKLCIVETDHKPLISIVKKSLDKISPRLQRMVVRLQRYDVQLEYVPGKNQVISDTLSRDPKEETIDTAFLDEEKGAVHTLVSATPERITELQEATQADSTMQLLERYCELGWPTKLQQVSPKLKGYWMYRDELYTSGKLIFRGNRIVIPEGKRSLILEKLHQSHIGIVQSKNRARGVVFWPGMSREIEEYVNRCLICQKHAKEQRREPLMSHSIPNRPWGKIGLDFMKVKGIEYITAIDYHSKYIEVKPMRKTSAEPVIKFIKEISARFGIPNVIVTDNGPPFDSAQYHRTLREWDIQSVTSSPRYPQSNGMVERGIQTCKSRITKTVEESGDIYTALLNYRATPHDGLGSPAELLMGRRIRTQLPITEGNLLPYYDTEETMRRLTENQEKQQGYANQGTKELSPLKQGEGVLYRHSEQDWREGTVREIGNQPRSYIVDDPGGGTYRRNRRHLKPWKRKTGKEPEPGDAPEPEREPDPRAVPGPKSDPNPEKILEPESSLRPREKETKVVTKSGREVIRPIRYRET